MEHEVEVTPDLVIRENFSVRPRDDIREWLEEHVGKRGGFSSKHGWFGKWYCHGTFRFNPSISFMEARDAMLFKLTWGGV